MSGTPPSASNASSAAIVIHSSRLDRGLDTEHAPFGSPDYSREELVAEMSAAFLCAASGISPPTIEQSGAYLQIWIKVLRGDKRLVIGAAGAAQKSVDLILGVIWGNPAQNGQGTRYSVEYLRSYKNSQGARHATTPPH